MDTLKPLSQAAWLLQVNKSTDEDAKEIAEKCTELNSVQVNDLGQHHVPFEMRKSNLNTFSFTDCEDFKFLHTD